MPRCSRGGCNVEFVDGSTDTCIHHSGGPVFHEGLKSWSCCSDVNKPVLSFDEFLSIPGCAKVVSHTSEAPQALEPKPAPSATFTVAESSDKDGKETFMTAPPPQKNLSLIDKNAPPALIIEEDDLTIPVSPGTLCRRKGCGVSFISDEENRQHDGPGTICIYHPAPPIFREGSKGYLCCKRRVLEFDEFLKIRGCKTGRHVFAVKSTAPAADEMVDCRIDHYQTRDKVFVSVFAKQVDKEHSVVRFDSPEQVTLDLHLPGSKRFSRVLNLAGPIDPAQSICRFYNTKVEVQLQKADNRVWVLLEKTNRNIEGISYTFGVGGRSGTVGGKEMHLDAVNKTGISQ